MDWTIALALYALVAAVAVALAAWTASTALHNRRMTEPFATSHRAWTVAGSILLPVTIAACVFAPVLRVPEAGLALAALPFLAFIATWSGVEVMRRHGTLDRLLWTPIFLLNCLLTAVYAVRVCQDFVGIDCGTAGAALTQALATTQTVCGSEAAGSAPLWLYIPFVIPLAERFDWRHRIAVGVGAAIAIAITATLLAAMPAAWQRAQAFRADSASARFELTDGPLSPRERRVRAQAVGEADLEAGQFPRTLCAVGVEMPWAERLLSDAHRERLHEVLDHLNVDHVTIAITPTLMEDEALRRQVEAEIAFMQGMRREVVVIIQPEPAVVFEDLDQLRRSLDELLWYASETLNADLLVPFSAPFAHLQPQLRTQASIQDWIDTASDVAADVARANPRVATAVAIHSRGPAAAELFRRLRSQDSPVDEVALGVRPDARVASAADIERGLQVLAGWIREVPGNRPIRVVDSGASPIRSGGKLGQQQFLLRAARVLVVDAGIDVFTVGPVEDRLFGPSPEIRGLVEGPAMRKRPVFDALLPQHGVYESGLSHAPTPRATRNSNELHAPRPASGG